MEFPEINEAKSRVPLALLMEEGDLELFVVSARMRQGLSEQFKLELRVRHKSELTVSGLIGKRLKVEFQEEREIPAISGICTAARFLAQDFDGTHYALTIEPRTAFMRLRRDHRVLKDCNAFGLAAALIEPLAARVGQVFVGDATALPVHEYRVQYGENSLQALMRMLAEDGVTFVYDHARESSLLLTADTSELELGERSIPFVAGASLATSGQPVVIAVATIARERIRRVRVGDDWVERPDFDAFSEVGIVSTGDSLEHYAFDYSTENNALELDRQAQLRLLEQVVPAHVLEVETNTLLMPGMALTIASAPTRESTAPLMVVSVESEWTAERGAARTLHRLQCIRRDQRWVPPRIDKPRIAGVQRAIVVGEGEIDTDQLGRVLCAFDWDRARSASRRVEVSQAWAGAGYGFFTQPRVGDEVLIAYLDGDPDEPIIVGRVHNGKNAHPNLLPESKNNSVWTSKSTPGGQGFNEIGMNDTAGAELLWMRAERDFDSLIQRDGTAMCGRDFSFEVGRHTNMKVVGHTTMVCQSPASWKGVDLDVDASGKFKLTCKTLEEHVADEYSRTIGASLTSRITANYNSFVGGTHMVMATTIVLNVPGAAITMTPGKIVLMAGSSVIEIGETIKMVSPLIDLNP